MKVEQQEEQQEETGKRRINLFCGWASKSIQIVAADEQKLDLGSIAGAFGLDPTTLKLNGHFISRGVDLIASSVTWKSLIGFFSARGFSTGATHSDALLVDGKPSKIGCKRSHTTSSGNGILEGWFRHKKRPHAESMNSVGVYWTKNQAWWGCNNTLDLKRKCCLEDESWGKKRRKLEWEEVVWGCSNLIGKTMKRLRGEEEMGIKKSKKMIEEAAGV